MPSTLQRKLRLVRSRFRPGVPCRLGKRRIVWQTIFQNSQHFQNLHYRSLSWSRAIEVIGQHLATELGRILPAPNLTLMVYRCAYSMQIPIEIANDCIRAIHLIQNHTGLCASRGDDITSKSSSNDSTGVNVRPRNTHFLTAGCSCRRTALIVHFLWHC